MNEFNSIRSELNLPVLNGIGEEWLNVQLSSERECSAACQAKIACLRTKEN